jgi:iron complex outermembrane receptor protein
MRGEIVKNQNRTIISRSLTSLLSAALIISAPVQADNILEVIEVTANKRTQGLQDVGVSVTAFSGEQLDALGFNSSVDLVAHTPGLEANGYGGGALSTFSIRGVGQNDFSANQEAPIAVYVDEAYISSNVTTRFSLFDVQRVEVLRGPQGTLFGRNSTGGLVHYVTANPTQDYEGFVKAEVGAEGRRRIEGAAGGGISDKVSARLAFISNQDDGLIKNEFSASSAAVRRTDDFSIRGKLLIEATEDLSVLLKVQLSDEDASPGGYSLGLQEGTEADFFGYSDEDGDPYTVSTDFDPFQTTEVTELGATVTWIIGDASVTSVTNYQDIESTYGEDADVTPNSLFHYTQAVNLEQKSQELRVNWEGDKHISVAGIYYLDIESDLRVEESGDIFFGPGAIFGIDAIQNTKTTAVFAQSEIELSDDLSLTLGLRANKDKKDYVLRSADFGFTDYTSNFSDTDYSGKIQLDYDINADWLMYGGINRGIKSGGFNLPLTPVDDIPIEYSGEVLTSLEIGFKGRVNETTRLNTSIYNYNYKDYQAFNIDQFFNTLLFNADAKIKGAEVELVMFPVDGLDILLGASYIDSEVTNLDPTLFPSGKEEAPLTPKLTLNGLVSYSWNLKDGKLAIQSDFNWKDDHKFNLATSAPVMEDAYAIFNAKLTYTSNSDNWSASIFVRNLFDEDYRMFAVDATAFFGSHENILGAERWVGANVRYSWY